MASNEVGKIPQFIDEAYRINLSQYRQCGGKFAAFADANDPSTIYVEVVATPMRHPTLGTTAGGLAYTDKKTIRCVIVAVNGMRDNPATSDLRQFKDYIRWEVGNIFMMRYGFMPKRIPEDEWGDKIPCK